MRGLIISSGNLHINTTLRMGGAHTIANVLRKNDIETEVIDFIDFWDNDDFKMYLKAQKSFDIIGLSYVFFSESRAKELVDICKKYNPKAKILIGGTSEFPDLGADYYLYSYAENAIKPVLDDIKGIAPVKHKLLHDGKWVNALHDYPSWPMKTYQYDFTDRDFIQEDEVVTIEFARGCRFACKYCEFPLIGMKQDTSISVDEMYDTFMYYHDTFGTTSFILAEDTFNDRVIKMEKMAKAVQKLPFKPRVANFARIDLYHRFPEMIELAAASGIVSQAYGIETFNHETGKIIGKGLHPDKVKETLLHVNDYMEKHGIHNEHYGYCTWIVGLPNESVESIMSTHEWFKNFWYPHGSQAFALRIFKHGNFLSAFSTDLAKYNYEEIENVEGINHWGFDKNPDVIPKTDSIIWKNQYLNRYDAMKIRNNIQADSRTNTLDAWNYLNITSRFPHININEIIKSNNNQAKTNTATGSLLAGKINRKYMINNELVDEYITRKIFG